MRKSLHWTLAVLAFCIFAFGACNSAGEKPKEIPKTAAEIRKAELLRQVEFNYKDPNAHYQLGKVYQNEGLWAQAEHEYSVALSFDPVHSSSQAAMVKVLLLSGDTAGSKSRANSYMSQAFSSAKGSLELAVAFQGEGLDEYANPCFQKALELAPDSARVNRGVGLYYLKKGQKDRARQYLIRSFRLNNNQPDVAKELGKLGVAVRTAQPAQKPAGSGGMQNPTVTPKK
jgi:Flp pilus assembly protein TadD